MTTALKRQALETALKFEREHAILDSMHYSIDPMTREILIKFEPRIADMNARWCRSAIAQLFQQFSNENGNVIEFDCSECREVYKGTEYAVYATLSYDAVSTLEMPPVMRLEAILRLYGATELKVTENAATGNIEALITAHNMDRNNLPSSGVAIALSWLDLQLGLLWGVKGSTEWLKVEAAHVPYEE